jgi:hypothetical protein
MSFDVFLHHFAVGESAPIDPAPVVAILARQQHTGPDDFGFYNVGFADGVSVEFNASGLDGRKPFAGCAFHVRGAGPGLFDFMFDVARAGDFVIFNAQGDDSAESPVLIQVRPGQEGDLSPGLVEQYTSRPVCTSGTMLQRLLFPDFEKWQDYRDQVVGN